MNYLPLVHRSTVYLDGKSVFSETLGQVIRWMREQAVQDRQRFEIVVQHHSTPLTFEIIELIARRTGSLGDTPADLAMAA